MSMNTEHREAFGARVRRLRRERGWSQNELRRRLAPLGWRVGQTTITKLENGDRPTPVEEAWALALVFGVTWDHLMAPLPTAPEPSSPRNLRVAERNRRTALVYASTEGPRLAAVADAFNVSRATAARYVRAAREAGVLESRAS